MSILNIKDLVEKVRAKACSGIVEDQTFIAEFCVLCDFATAAEAKLSTLRDELARSESATPDKHPDTERLDWLAGTTNGVSFAFGSGKPIVSLGAAFPQFTGEDLRAAIDAARKQGGAHD